MSSAALESLKPEVDAFSEKLAAVQREVGRVVVGQQYMVERLLLALIADGHILLEGLPGLAKTTAVKTLAGVVQTDFSRISFTPDLLPADVIGTEIYRPNTGEFSVKKGPIFTNLLLADEINRAPAKVQSALLEAMQERQVTLGDQTYQLDRPFLVLATQNPVEQEGNVSVTGGSGRPLHAQAQDWLSKPRRRARDYASRVNAASRATYDNPHPRGYPECAPACRSDLHGSQSRELYCRPRLRDP